jgi:toxin ParE1/3/4
MRYSINRHPSIESDFEQIQDFIAPVAGIRIARRIAREIDDRIADLRDYPNIGTIHSDVRPGLRALHAAPKAVICVTYAGQDWQRIARGRE